MENEANKKYLSVPKKIAYGSGDFGSNFFYMLVSSGNEVAEPCEKKGLQVGSAMIECIHSHDHTRPVTCGTNLMVMGRAAKGQGIYQDGETNTTSSSKEQKKESNNSLAFNIMASVIGRDLNAGGNSKTVDAISNPFLDRLDIAGYNYGSGRYPLEGKHIRRELCLEARLFHRISGKTGKW